MRLIEGRFGDAKASHFAICVSKNVFLKNGNSSRDENPEIDIVEIDVGKTKHQRPTREYNSQFCTVNLQGFAAQMQRVKKRDLKSLQFLLESRECYVSIDWLKQFAGGKPRGLPTVSKMAIALECRLEEFANVLDKDGNVIEVIRGDTGEKTKYALDEILDLLSNDGFSSARNSAMAFGDNSVSLTHRAACVSLKSSTFVKIESAPEHNLICLNPCSILKNGTPYGSEFERNSKAEDVYRAAFDNALQISNATNLFNWILRPVKITVIMELPFGVSLYEEASSCYALAGALSNFHEKGLDEFGTLELSALLLSGFYPDVSYANLFACVNENVGKLFFFKRNEDHELLRKLFAAAQDDGYKPINMIAEIKENISYAGKLKEQSKDGKLQSIISEHELNFSEDKSQFPPFHISLWYATDRSTAVGSRVLNGANIKRFTNYTEVFNFAWINVDLAVSKKNLEEFFDYIQFSSGLLYHIGCISKEVYLDLVRIQQSENVLAGKVASGRYGGTILVFTKFPVIHDEMRELRKTMMAIGMQPLETFRVDIQTKLERRKG